MFLITFGVKMSKKDYFEFVTSSRKITSQSIIGMLLSILSVYTCVYFIVTASSGTPVALAHRLMFVSLVVMMIYLSKPTGRKSWNDKFTLGAIWDFFCTVCAIACVIYYLSDLEGWQLRMFMPNMLDTIFGTILVFLILEATRRAVGLTMLFVVIFFLLLTVFTNYFPGFLRGAPTSWRRLVDILVSEQGLFSEPIQTMASYIILFLLFGTILEESGAGKYFIDIAYSVGGRFTAGPAKTAVIASALFGSISGSSVSNVVSTGCFTIPLMKATGISPEEAGATEAVASTGGNYMPPIMGAVAFVMAQYLRVPYITIVGHAIIPALLYYMALLLYVHFSGKKRGMVPLKPENLPSAKKSIIEGGHLILSLVCLVVFLIFGYTTTMGAFWGVLVLFLLTFVRKGTRLKPIQMVRAFEKTAKMVLSVGSACAAAGIIIGCMYASGLSLSLSNIIIDLAHNNVLVVLILTAVFSLILGCGMPSVGVYLILVMTIIPALTQMGITPMAAHFFAFYFAVVSNITPPVCVAAFAGAAIAGASPMKTGFKAFVIGSAAYIIPFLFVYHPATLGIGTPGEIAIACIDGTIAIFGLAACIVGFVIFRLNIIERLIGLAICLLVTAPHMATNITAYTLLVIMIAVQFVKYKKNQTPKVGEVLA